MLMKLLWTVAEPLIRFVFMVMPQAPEPIDLVLPWPAWLPFAPFATAIGMVVVTGVATVITRGIRWLYGLIPVVQ